MDGLSFGDGEPAYDEVHRGTGQPLQLAAVTLTQHRRRSRTIRHSHIVPDPEASNKYQRGALARPIRPCRYFGPLLVGALTAMAANLAMLAFITLIPGWGVVTVVRTVGGTTTNKHARKGR